MNNLCPSCSHPIEANDMFCKHCGYKIKQSPQPSVVTKTGRESVNIGVGNLPNANIHIGDKYEVNRKVEKPAYITRRFARQMKVGNIEPKASWLTISGVIGVLGSLASMVSAFVDIESVGAKWFSSSWFFFIFILAMVLLILGFSLQRFRFINISWFNQSIETGKNGQLYLTKIGGSCPKCGAELQLTDVGTQNRKKTMVLCSRNPEQHRWGFDPTVLHDL